MPLAVLALLLAQTAPSPKPAEKPKMVVLALKSGGGIDASVASALTDSLAEEVGRSGYFDVLAASEIQTMLGQERQRQVLGCAEEASCLAELAGALGARFVLSGSLAKLGNAYQLSLQALDSQKAQSMGRASRLAPNLETLRKALPYAVAEATGAPPPPAPSRVLPWTLMGAGAAAIVGGGVFGLQALGQEEALLRELRLGEAQGSVLQTRAFYEEEHRRLGTQKTVALAVMVTGAALLGVGIWLNPPAEGGGGALALVPSVQGGALVGVFP